MLLRILNLRDAIFVFLKIPLLTRIHNTRNDAAENYEETGYPVSGKSCGNFSVENTSRKKHTLTIQVLRKSSRDR